MPELRVSVIIPAFNAEAYLAEAIDSVLAQTLPPFEVIVVDDGSTDATAAIARRFAPAVNCFSQPNGGIGAARNSGVRAAHGNALAFLDADDLWLAAKLSLQVGALLADPALDLVFGHAEQFISPHLAGAQGRPGVGGPMPGYVAGTLLVRREAFLRVGPFATGLKVGEFIDWYARARDIGLKAHLLPDVVLRRRIHDTNTGIRERDSRVEYARVLRAALARRRAAGGPGS
jgi:glycosyltransferase involved in cell wall biosynthesis